MTEGGGGSAFLRFSFVRKAGLPQVLREACRAASSSCDWKREGCNKAASFSFNVCRIHHLETTVLLLPTYNYLSS